MGTPGHSGRWEMAVRKGQRVAQLWALQAPQVPAAKLGQRVPEQLVARAVMPVRVVSRSEHSQYLVPPMVPLGRALH
jgi:hypothetical protein